MTKRRTTKRQPRARLQAGLSRPLVQQILALGLMAAGAIKPRVGFKYAWENGADFVCAGMFDFQVIPNANTVSEVLNSSMDRQRSWFA